MSKNVYQKQAPEFAGTYLVFKTRENIFKTYFFHDCEGKDAMQFMGKFNDKNMAIKWVENNYLETLKESLEELEEWKKQGII